jgi:hypothetical protein
MNPLITTSENFSRSHLFGHAPLPPAREPASLNDALARLTELATHSSHIFASPLGPFTHGDESFTLPRFLFVGENAAEEAWRIGIYAGLDGTDTRSALAVLRALERFALEPVLGHSFNLVFYPVTNPSGFADGTKRTRAGHLLSDHHWASSPAPELHWLERDARSLQFHGVILVQSDPETDEIQGWLRGFSPGEPFLHAEPVRGTSKVGYFPFKFPVQWEPHPDGFHADTGPLTLADDFRTRPFETTLVIPAKPPLEWAFQAVSNTLRVFLNNFRTAAATGQNI